MKWLKLLRDIAIFAGITIRRNTLCRVGSHKIKVRKTTLALGELIDHGGIDLAKHKKLEKR